MGTNEQKSVCASHCVARGPGLFKARIGTVHRYRMVWTVAFVSMAVFLLAQTPPVRADEISDLKAMIKQLEDRVNALEAERAAAKPAPAPAAAPAPAEVKAPPAAPSAPPVAAVQPVPPAAAAPYRPPATIKDNEDSAQRVDNAVIDPTMKGFFRIPGTETLMKLGGYSKVDFIYDTKPIGSYDYFVTSEIPTSGPNTTRGTQFTVQAKQTRLDVDLRRDTEAGPARLYIEGDWFGNASFDFQPGSYQAQLRHAYGQLENFASGYSFSAFMDNDALPDTLDFEGPGAAPFLLVAAARYIYKVNPHANVTLSAEAPQSQVTAPTGGGKSTFPDITLRGRYEADIGHVQLAGVYRRLGWDSDDGEMESTNGYGFNLSGSLKSMGEDYAVAGAMWGKGIARYVSDITGLGLDAVVTPGSGGLQALIERGGYAAYTHYWTHKLRSTAVVDYLGMNNEPYQAPETFRDSQYYSTNLVWNPAGSLNLGVEVLFGNYRTLDDHSANDTRVQMSVQYDFVR